MSIEEFFEGQTTKGRGRVSKKCSICRDERLAKEVETYVQRRQSGDTALSAYQIWRRYFATTWGMGSPATLDNHIRLHMGIDLSDD